MENYPEPEVATSFTGESNPAQQHIARLSLSLANYESLADPELFAGLPSRREALSGLDNDRLQVFLFRSIAKKLYHCGWCSGDIAIGEEHVLLAYARNSQTYDHHHLDRSCVQNRLLPSLTNLRILKVEEASKAALPIKKRDRKHYRHRVSY